MAGSRTALAMGVGLLSGLVAGLVIVLLGAVASHGGGEPFWLLPPVMFGPVSQAVASVLAVLWISFARPVPRLVVGVLTLAGTLLLFVGATAIVFGHVSWRAILVVATGGVFGSLLAVAVPRREENEGAKNR